MQAEVIAKLINLMDEGWSGSYDDIDFAIQIRGGLSNNSELEVATDKTKEVFSKNEFEEMSERLSFARGDRGVKKEEGFTINKDKNSLDASLSVGLNRLSKAVIFTDGSFKPDKRRSGSGYALCQHKNGDYRNYGMSDVVQYGYIGYNGGNSNGAELVAVRNALEKLPKKIKKVTIFSDSLTLVDKINEGALEAWGKSNKVYMRKQFEDGKDHWSYIYKKMKDVEVSFVWIKGHNDSRLNIFADKLADIGSDS